MRTSGGYLCEFRGKPEISSGKKKKKLFLFSLWLKRRLANFPQNFRLQYFSFFLYWLIFFFLFWYKDSTEIRQTKGEAVGEEWEGETGKKKKSIGTLEGIRIRQKTDFDTNLKHVALMKSTRKSIFSEFRISKRIYTGLKKKKKNYFFLVARNIHFHDFL